jgi:aquaporin Z
MDFTKLWRPLIAELIGTFVLCLLGGGAAALAGGQGGFGVLAVAFGHGLALMIIVYTFGHISGAHVNPAVTFALVVARKLDPLTAAFYWLAQFVGAALAGAVLLYVLVPGVGAISSVGSLGATRFLFPERTTGVNLDYGPAFVLEALMTFCLCSTVLQAAVYGRAGNLAGVAIGMTLAACILFGGPLTGASLNPARTFSSEFGLTIGGGVAAWNTYWLYVLAPLFGGALAGGLHGYVLAPAEPASDTDDPRLRRRRRPAPAGEAVDAKDDAPRT